VKIKIERPDRGAASDIFQKYLTTEIPIAQSETRQFGGEANSDRSIVITEIGGS